MPARRRIYLSAEFISGKVSLDREQDHYVRRVLRLREGAPVEVFDGQGRTGEAVLLAPGEGIEVGAIESHPEPAPIHLACALPKGERADWMFEKLAELGPLSIHLLNSEFSQGAISAKKKERLHRQLVAGCRQSGNPWIPRLEGPCSPETLFEKPELVEARHWVLNPNAEKNLHQELEENDRAGAQLLWVGPEGGWSVQELAAFEAQGYTQARIAPWTLRVETAALLSVGMMISHRS